MKAIELWRGPYDGARLSVPDEILIWIMADQLDSEPVWEQTDVPASVDLRDHAYGATKKFHQGAQIFEYIGERAMK